MEISLPKNEITFFDSEFFILKEGEIIVRYIFEDGKISNFEFPLKPGEINGNFFGFLPEDSPFYNEISVEVVATKDSVLDVFELDSKTLNIDMLKKIILQLIKQLSIKLWFQLYSKEDFILLILKIYTRKYNKSLKKHIKYDVLNLSRSQFYLLYSKLKKQKNIIEKLGRIKVC